MICSSSASVAANGLNNHANGFSYDGLGNVTKDNLSNSYVYDAEGRQTTVAVVTTTFDALGRAVERQGGLAYTQFVHSPSGAKFAFMNGTTLVRYIDPMMGGMAAVHNGPNVIRRTPVRGTRIHPSRVLSAPLLCMWVSMRLGLIPEVGGIARDHRAPSAHRRPA